MLAFPGALSSAGAETSVGHRKSRCRPGSDCEDRAARSLDAERVALKKQKEQSGARSRSSARQSRSSTAQTPRSSATRKRQIGVKDFARQRKGRFAARIAAARDKHLNEKTRASEMARLNQNEDWTSEEQRVKLETACARVRKQRQRRHERKTKTEATATEHVDRTVRSQQSAVGHG